MTLDLCYKIAGVPSNEEVKEIFDILLKKENNYNQSITIIDKLIKSQGYSLSIVLKELVSFLLNNKMKTIDTKNLAIYLSEMSDLENRVTKSTFGDIYMAGLVGIFKKIE